MNEPPPIVPYEANRPRARVWGLSRPAWLMAAGFCGFVEFAGLLATNGRVNGWGDATFIAVFAAIGLVALINAGRLVRRAG